MTGNGGRLRTQIAGLYVCDSSVLPEPDGLPPVLTIIALGRRLVADSWPKDDRRR